jgi:hypothetical protein
VLSDELKNFQLNLPLLLQEKNMKEEEFLKYLLPVEAAFNSLFAETPFDLKSKIKNVVTISTTYTKDEDILNEFFLNEAAQFWFKSFPKKDFCQWQSFLDKFTPVYMGIFDKDMEFLPAEKKANSLTIKDNIKLLMKYELETNNDMKITREGWNAFSFKILFNFTQRSKLVERASVLAPTIVQNKIQLTYIYDNGTLIEGADQKKFVIAKDGVEKREEDEEEVKKKDLTVAGTKITVGRNIENDIKLEAPSVSRNHFTIWMKRNLDGQQIKNEFYLSNVSKSFLFFVVDEDGYLLAKNHLINLSDNKQFAIREMHPEFSPKSGFLSIEPEFLGAKRMDLSHNLLKNKSPFIEIEFLDDNRKENKSAKNEEEDFTFNIGSGPKDTVQVSDKREGGEEMIEPNHCQIKYDGKNKCWVIKDQNIVQPGNKTIYKTNLLCYNDKQYEDIGDFSGTMRGIKLMTKMKVLFGTSVFQMSEI